MKKGFLIFFIGISSYLLSYNAKAIQDNFESHTQIDTQTPTQTYTFADLLLWKFRAAGTENWAQEISPSGPRQNIRILGVPFKWKPGFRLGLGRELDYDCWDLMFTYTWYHSVGKNKAGIPAGGIYSPFLGNFFANNTTGNSNFGPNYQQANVRWKLLFNTGDLEVGRSFNINPILTLRPYMGIKVGLIHQRIHSHWNFPTNANNFSFATENLKNNFNGVGPVMGLNTNWCIMDSTHSSLSLMGNFSGSLMWGHWRFKDQYRNNRPASIAVNLRNLNGATTVGRGLIGFEWMTYFTGAELSLRLGYEAQVWFNQLQFYSLNMGRLNNLMSLQGAVFGLGFYF